MSGFEPVTLFVRGEEGSSEEDAWDDTILVEQYDLSVNQLKSKVAKIMGVSHGESDTRPSKEKTHSHVQNRSKRHKKKSTNWEIGSFCRAKYSADKVFYEATILSINKDRRTCCVKYIGYDNQEDVYLDILLPSEGHLARQAQEEQAMAEQLQEVDDTEDTEEMVHSDSNSVNEASEKLRKKGHQVFTDHRHPKWQKNKTTSPDNRSSSSQNIHVHGGQQLGWPSHIPPGSLLPPPPPPPPHIFEHLPNDDGEALSSMLMSWYMSGYHTGYYYGLKQAKLQEKMGKSGGHHGRRRKN